MQSMPEYNMMVDLETTSLVPWEGRPTSLGFVIFDRDFRIRSVHEVQIGMQPLERALFRDNEHTMEFRAKEGIDCAESQMNVQHVTEVLKRICRDFDFFKDMFIWAKPMKFDIIFIERLFKLHDMHEPWHYRHVMDTRSFCMGRGWSAQELQNVERKIITFDGKQHTPLADALHQVKVLQYCVENKP